MNDKCDKCGHSLSRVQFTHWMHCPHCEATKAANKPADQGQVGGTHYKELAVQPWHVMESVLTPEEFRGFLKGNIIKYAMRQGKKQDSDDANKCIHYQQKLEEVLGRKEQL